MQVNCKVLQDLLYIVYIVYYLCLLSSDYMLGHSRTSTKSKLQSSSSLESKHIKLPTRNIWIDPPHRRIGGNRVSLLVLGTGAIALIDALVEEAAAIICRAGPADGEAAAVGQRHLQRQVFPATRDARIEEALGDGATRDVDVVGLAGGSGLTGPGKSLPPSGQLSRHSLEQKIRPNIPQTDLQMALGFPGLYPTTLSIAIKSRNSHYHEDCHLDTVLQGIHNRCRYLGTHADP